MEKEIAEGNVSGMGGRKGRRSKMVMLEQMSRSNFLTVHVGALNSMYSWLP